ncbi:uncharacterized protein LOC132551742 [Ylistrum balloti]|uniref:uncharacterized protein LOC132551742 n=1 Tax=Ylistrum balloti TaxID=509963 RepID=UPI002905A392|nr:uncharacterized protein LOC132551742 [Ylistrum balloti]
MWVVLILALLGHVSEGVVIPVPEPHGLSLPTVLPIHQSSLLKPPPIALSTRRTLPAPVGIGSGLVSSLLEGIIGGRRRAIHHDHLLEEPIDRILGDTEGLDHGHVGDRCQHRTNGCDVPGYHCVLTSVSSYIPCFEGQAAHCHCKLGCLHRGRFYSPEEGKHTACRKCRCVEGEMICRKKRRCWRGRRRDRLERRLDRRDRLDSLDRLDRLDRRIDRRDRLDNLDILESLDRRDRLDRRLDRRSFSVL